jgi:hypothetical protein
MDNRTLLALSRDLQHKSATEVDKILGQKYRDPQERLSVKIQIDAMAATGRSMRALGEMAHDRAEWSPGAPDPRPRSEMDRWLDRIQVDRQRTYTEAELGTLLDQAGVTEPEQRIAVRLECRAQGLTRDVSDADRLLRALNISGPVDLLALEQTMDQRGYMPSIKTVIKSACQQRGWLKGGGNRTLRAAAETHSTRLVDRHTGQARTLKSYPE